MELIGPVALVASLVTYVAIGFYGSAQNHRSSFFHIAGVRKGVIALVVANVTLGTGLAYLLTAGSMNGLLVLSIAFGVFTGYWLLSIFLASLPDSLTGAGGNLLMCFRNAIESQRPASKTHGRSVFDAAILIPLVAAFIMFFAYEIFVSSKIIAAVAFPESGAYTTQLVAVLIFVAALAYCLVGGMAAVYTTAIIQLIGILLFLGLITYASVATITASQFPIAQQFLYRGDKQALINCLTGFTDAVATQFYSLINAFGASHLRATKQKARLMRINGAILAAIFSLIILIGTSTPHEIAADIGAYVSRISSSLSSIPFGSAVLITLLVFGMVSVVISTADTLIVALTYFIYENVGRREGAETSQDISSIRKLMATLFLISFFALLALFSLQPNIFYLLLSIASGPVVMAPLMVALGAISRTPGALGSVSDPWLAAFGGLFVIASTASFTSLALAPSLVPYASLFHLSLSTVLALALYLFVRTRRVGGGSDGRTL
ncbi:hypothetical protein [Hyphomicrobium sp. LHD-15]|uniref:hypothetical protein n=1 Tax=Hyphomicrobium sp. LHD-15 TaxID=3072142 RepID=UPI00280E2647|nr:hypothetical protein [Hyphomicrobium sp. LHD-15]MDQ8699259.1 hypothetical protein [Hyphomicrobium sp. LHD-15]